jgi:hypothetical protein
VVARLEHERDVRAELVQRLLEGGHLMKELIRSNERQAETVNQGPSEASFDP